MRGMEHSDLIAEMSQVEHMSTQERLLLARRRRMQQLKVWSQREKEWQKRNNGAKNSDKSTTCKKNKRNIVFDDNVMLLEAASRNDIEEVRRLLMKNVSPNATNEDGLTALHQCCIDDNEEMMKLLIEFGADVNAEDSEKWTPLHAAATCGHLHLVSHLINSGANLLAVNADGNMPYDICEEETALDYIENEMARRGVTQELIDETRASTETRMLKDLQIAALQGYDLEMRNEQRATPLHIASANGYLRVVEFLLDQHVSTEVKDLDDWQPVHAAACWGHLDVLELLVQNGADLNARTKHDETPADICEDPELRERIMQLKCEQESKRLQEAQRRRVKRTQSNNTRAQSVRRISIREKTLVSKKDAKEEAALFRLHAHDVDIVDNKIYEMSDVESSLEYTPVEGGGTDANANDVVSRDNNLTIGRREPEGKDNDSIRSVGSDAMEAARLPLDFPTETSYTTESNGKINIHVSVTINASTLAELKKQRAQNRNSSPDVGAAGGPNAIASSGIAGQLESENASTTTTFNRGDHTESIMVDYNPLEISYEELLDIFWKNHDPTSIMKRQYTSLIFYFDEEQKAIAEKSAADVERKLGQKLVTEILPASTFYDAEDYHQKYRLQQHPWLCKELGLQGTDFKKSHVAARVNGYVYGQGSMHEFNEEAAKLGLYENAANYIRVLIKKNEGQGLSC